MIRVLGGPVGYQQIYNPSVTLTGIQSKYLHPFDIRVSQVYNPVLPPDDSKGIQYFYFHPFSKALYLPIQIDGEYEVVEPPVGSPTFSGGRIGIHRDMKRNNKFDERDIADIIQLLIMTETI